mmetsp:Transcript_39654/g.71140  ORF Transcript_39654/g.71140 Transcript_39654/m.71140 type:complete len:222 (-) Transcript_39654:853-1518(-)
MITQPCLSKGSVVAPRGSRRATLRVRAAKSSSDRACPAPPASRSRRGFLGLALAAAVVVQAPGPGASASGLESIDMMDIPKRTAEELMEIQAESRAKLKEADSVFENSELLATLKAKSEANKEKCAVPPPTSSPSIVLVPMLSAALIPCHVRLSPQEREGAVQQVLHEAGRAGHRGLWWAEVHPGCNQKRETEDSEVASEDPRRGGGPARRGHQVLIGSAK